MAVCVQRLTRAGKTPIIEIVRTLKPASTMGEDDEADHTEIEQE